MDDAREKVLRGAAARWEKHVTLIIARSCGRFEICGRRGISRELSRTRARDSNAVNIARLELAPDFWRPARGRSAECPPDDPQCALPCWAGCMEQHPAAKDQFLALSQCENCGCG